jgi:hypothetical protein
MPWKANDAKSFTKKAKSPDREKRSGRTSPIPCSKRGADDGAAIRAANAAVAKRKKGKK